MMNLEIKTPYESIKHKAVENSLTFMITFSLRYGDNSETNESARVYITRICHFTSLVQVLEHKTEQKAIRFVST